MGIVIAEVERQQIEHRITRRQDVEKVLACS